MHAPGKVHEAFDAGSHEPKPSGTFPRSQNSLRGTSPTATAGGGGGQSQCRSSKAMRACSRRTSCRSRLFSITICSRRCESLVAMAVRRRGTGAWWCTIVRYIKFLHARIMSLSADSSGATPARDSQPDVGVQNPQAQSIAKNMSLFAQRMHTNSKRRLELSCVPNCVKNVVELVNALSAPFLGSFFQIDYRQVLGNAQQVDTLQYYLQVTCKFYATSELESTNIIDPSQEAVVSRLYILISKRETKKRKFTEPYPCMEIRMHHGATALCVREMHLATVLRICALLLAQQIAYCGSSTESVCFQGEAVSDATIKIYTDLFDNLKRVKYTSSGNSARSLELYAQVFNPGAAIPQTLINASNMLSKCRTKSGDLCHAPFPRQIRDLTSEERTHKAAKDDAKTHAASGSALFLHAHCHAQSLLPVCYVRCCVLKPVYFE